MPSADEALKLIGRGAAEILMESELKQRLASQSLRQLRQRITVRYHISPLTHEQTEEYIYHRLRVAGSDGRIQFTAAALRAVYKYSRGVPRLINAVCDNVLLAGYVMGTTCIDVRCVKKAIDQLEGPK